jgi:hypothetical protein
LVCMACSVAIHTSKFWRVVANVRRSRAAIAGRDGALKRWASHWACHRCRQAFGIDDSRMIDVEALRAAVWQESGFNVRGSSPRRGCRLRRGASSRLGRVDPLREGGKSAGAEVRPIGGRCPAGGVGQIL